MFSDTHFHLHHIVEERGIDGVGLLDSLAQKDTPFLLDIGTHCDDLKSRYELACKIENNMEAQNRNKIKNVLHFSAGIWPASEAIIDRESQIKVLENQINDFSQNYSKGENCSYNFSANGQQSLINNAKIPVLCALGECGLDHHWQADGVDNRDKADFDFNTLKGESELFCMQLELARKIGLPVIVHTRDAFDGTLGCIREIGYDCGVIHCFSYGIEQARAFLDRGWYISFSGSVTYAKKSKVNEIFELLRFIPRDKILLETDAPYLAPVPERGKTNTPIFIEHTYDFVSEALGLTSMQTAQLILSNSESLFKEKA